MDVVFDIGGTKTRSGIVSESGKLLETALFLTNKDYRKGINDLIGYIKGKDIRAGKICLGLPGVLDKDKKELYSAPNLKDWIGKPLKDTLEREFSANVFLENDAALAGLGEAVYGAGKGYKIIAYLTIGTGVGGARIVNGAIDEKVYGFEPGHHIIDVGTAVSGSTFETIASGGAIKKTYGGRAEDITDKKNWEKIIKNIAIGVANTVYFWSPEAIILGGGVSRSEYFDVSILRKEVGNILKKTYPSIPEIKKSSLGDFSGIWGGVAYMKDYM